MVEAYIALGSNLGDRLVNLRGALERLAATPGIELLRVSQFHETPPVGGPAGQPDFLNAAAAVRTTLSAAALLERLLAIETEFGRVRSVLCAPRTLDLDLLLYGDERFDQPGLTVPHPRMWQRDFVMVPLRQVCPAALLGRMAPPAREEMALHDH